eukprot:scaffold25751_cov78-Skeletonema_dohrnii-CCMP3373.AAC.1
MSLFYRMISVVAGGNPKQPKTSPKPQLTSNMTWKWEMDKNYRDCEERFLRYLAAVEEGNEHEA